MDLFDFKAGTHDSFPTSFSTGSNNWLQFEYFQYCDTYLDTYLELNDPMASINPVPAYQLIRIQSFKTNFLQFRLDFWTDEVNPDGVHWDLHHEALKANHSACRIQVLDSISEA